MKKAILCSLLIFTIGCNVFGTTRTITKVDNSKAIELTNQWKKATQAEKLKQSFVLAEEYIKTIEAEPVLLSSDFLEKEGDYSKYSYIFEVNKIQYRVDIIDREDREATSWQIASYIGAVLFGMIISPNGSILAVKLLLPFIGL